jgi:poly(A) polymerase
MVQVSEIRTKPPCRREDALAVTRRLRDAGHVAYFAGGCVRDALLGLEPADWDVATDAPPDVVRRTFANTQAVGAAFGVILVRIGHSHVEVATFRRDGQYLDGRRPRDVQFTDAEHDAQRRDFTINGLFLDPLADGGQRVIDYVGGLADLSAKVLRAIGNPDDRFAEDHLRMLRAARFAARFALEIEPRTEQAIVRDAGKLIAISPERIGEELRRMLTAPTRALAWPTLDRLGLLAPCFRFLPGVDRAKAAPAVRSILLALAPGSPIDFPLALAAATLEIRWHAAGDGPDIRSLLVAAALHDCHRAMRRCLRISNEESDGMTRTLTGIASLLDDRYPTLAARKRFAAGATAASSRRLLDAIAAVGLHEQRIAQLRQDLSQLDGQDVAPRPLVSGDDLTAMGLTPGPMFKAVLDAVYDAQLEGRLADRDSALDAARRAAAARAGR